MRTRFRVAVGACLVAALGQFASPAGAATVAPGQMVWMAAGSAISAMRQVPNSRIVSAYFSNSNDLIDGSRPSIVPAGWSSTPTAVFSDFNLLHSAVNQANPWFAAVMYDNEAWAATPPAQQANPTTFTQRAAADAHAHGLQFVAAPGVDLITVIDPSHAGPGLRYNAYINDQVAANAARFADVFVIQAQGSQNNPAMYASFVSRAAAQARQANPSVIVLAGISTGPNGQATTAQQIVTAVKATDTVVDGYFMNVPSQSPGCPNCGPSKPGIAVQALKLLAA